MVTVINTPSSGNGNDSGAGIVIGVILAIILIVLFIVYGVPAIRDNRAPQEPGTTNIIVTPPAVQNNPPSNP